jgi:nucleotide-binding universal stress UspA family protein
VFHPTDFSEASEIAFAHALKLTVHSKAALTILHVDAGSTLRWQDFPGVRMMLERWGVIPRGSLRSAVAKLGIDVNKVISPSKNAVKACVNFLEKNPTDLIVLAVRQESGRMRWLEKSVGKPIARAAGQITLFIPHGMEGFVSRKDGSISLKNILLPVTSKPRPQPGVEAAARLIRNLRLAPGAVTVLHVGPAAEMPSIKIPTDGRWTWKRLAKAGDPAIILQLQRTSIPI